MGTSRWSALINPKSALLFSFFAGFAVRFIPEVIGYPAPIGYNTVAYYAPVLADYTAWGNAWLISLFHSPQFSPLVYLLMIPVAQILGPYLTLTIFAPTLNGILAVAVYWFLKQNSGFSYKLCALGSFFTVIQYSALEFSLGMFSESLALSLGLFTLSTMLTGASKWREILISMGLVATGLANQMVLLTLLPCIMYCILKTRAEMTRRLVTFSIILLPSLIFLAWNWSILQGAPEAFPAAEGVTVYFFGGYRSSTGISPFANYVTVLSYPELLARVVGYLLFLYVPLLPWMRRKSLSGGISKWALVILLVTLSPIIVPWFAFDLWNLWAITLCIPLSIMAFQGLAGFARKPRYSKAAHWRGLVLLAVLLPYMVVAAGYMALPPERPLSIFTYPPFLTYMSTSMLTNTVTLQDSLNALALLKQLNSTMGQGSVLIVHESFYGFTALTISGHRFIIDYHLGDPVSAATYAQTLGFSRVYWIWWLPGYGWHGLVNPPAGFSIILQKGNIAVYQYTP